MGNPDAARSLFADAGFDIKYFDTAEFTAKFPSVSDFVNGVAAGAPATRHAIAQLSPPDNGAFINDVRNIGAIRNGKWCRTAELSSSDFGAPMTLDTDDIREDVIRFLNIIHLLGNSF